MTTGIEPLVERLAAHRLLGGVPRDQLRWLADRSTVDHFEAGAVVTRDITRSGIYAGNPARLIRTLER